MAPPRWRRCRLTSTATSRRDGDEIATTLDLSNPGSVPALAIKLAVTNAEGTQVLPPYFTHNYVSLLARDKRRIEIRYRACATKGKTTVALRGWNVTPSAGKVR